MALLIMLILLAPKHNLEERGPVMIVFVNWSCVFHISAVAINVLAKQLTALVVALEKGRDAAGRPAFTAEPARMIVADYFLPSGFWAMAGPSRAGEESAIEAHLRTARFTSRGGPRSHTRPSETVIVPRITHVA